MNLKQAIVFAILMENNEGIVGKAQSYIKEKMHVVEGLQFPERMLDPINFAKFEKWQKRWGIKFEEEK